MEAAARDSDAEAPDASTAANGANAGAAAALVVVPGSTSTSFDGLQQPREPLQLPQKPLQQQDLQQQGAHQYCKAEYQQQAQQGIPENPTSFASSPRSRTPRATGSEATGASRNSSNINAGDDVQSSAIGGGLIEAEAGHIYRPGTKAEVRLVYRIKKGVGAGRHQKSYSISRYGLQGAWEQAEAARLFINTHGHLPPHFSLVATPARSTAAGGSRKGRAAAAAAAAGESRAAVAGSGKRITATHNRNNAVDGGGVSISGTAATAPSTVRDTSGSYQAESMTAASTKQQQQQLHTTKRAAGGRRGRPQTKEKAALHAKNAGVAAAAAAAATQQQHQQIYQQQIMSFNTNCSPCVQQEKAQYSPTHRQFLQQLPPFSNSGASCTQPVFSSSLAAGLAAAAGAERVAATYRVAGAVDNCRGISHAAQTSFSAASVPAGPGITTALGGTRSVEFHRFSAGGYRTPAGAGAVSVDSVASPAAGGGEATGAGEMCGLAPSGDFFGVTSPTYVEQYRQSVDSQQRDTATVTTLATPFVGIQSAPGPIAGATYSHAPSAASATDTDMHGKSTECFAQTLETGAQVHGINAAAAAGGDEARDPTLGGIHPDHVSSTSTEKSTTADAIPSKSEWELYGSGTEGQNTQRLSLPFAARGRNFSPYPAGAPNSSSPHRLTETTSASPQSGCSSLSSSTTAGGTSSPEEGESTDNHLKTCCSDGRLPAINEIGVQQLVCDPSSLFLVREGDVESAFFPAARTTYADTAAAVWRWVDMGQCEAVGELGQLPHSSNSSCKVQSEKSAVCTQWNWFQLPAGCSAVGGETRCSADEAIATTAAEHQRHLSSQRGAVPAWLLPLLHESDLTARMLPSSQLDRSLNRGGLSPRYTYASPAFPSSSLALQSPLRSPVHSPTASYSAAVPPCGASVCGAAAAGGSAGFCSTTSHAQGGGAGGARPSGGQQHLEAAARKALAAQLFAVLRASGSRNSSPLLRSPCLSPSLSVETAAASSGSTAAANSTDSLVSGLSPLLASTSGRRRCREGMQSSCSRSDLVSRLPGSPNCGRSASIGDSEGLKRRCLNVSPLLLAAMSFHTPPSPALLSPRMGCVGATNRSVFKPAGTAGLLSSSSTNSNNGSHTTSCNFLMPPQLTGFFPSPAAAASGRRGSLDEAAETTAAGQTAESSCEDLAERQHRLERCCLGGGRSAFSSVNSMRPQPFAALCLSPSSFVARQKASMRGSPLSPVAAASRFGLVYSPAASPSCCWTPAAAAVGDINSMRECVLGRTSGGVGSAAAPIDCQPSPGASAVAAAAAAAATAAVLNFSALPPPLRDSANYSSSGNSGSSQQQQQQQRPEQLQQQAEEQQSAHKKQQVQQKQQVQPQEHQVQQDQQVVQQDNPQVVQQDNPQVVQQEHKGLVEKQPTQLLLQAKCEEQVKDHEQEARHKSRAKHEQHAKDEQHSKDEQHAKVELQAKHEQHATKQHQQETPDLLKQQKNTAPAQQAAKPQSHALSELQQHELHPKQQSQMEQQQPGTHQLKSEQQHALEEEQNEASQQQQQGGQNQSAMQQQHQPLSAQEQVALLRQQQQHQGSCCSGSDNLWPPSWLRVLEQRMLNARGQVNSGTVLAVAAVEGQRRMRALIKRESVRSAGGVDEDSSSSWGGSSRCSAVSRRRLNNVTDLLLSPIQVHGRSGLPPHSAAQAGDASVGAGEAMVGESASRDSPNDTTETSRAQGERHCSVSCNPGSPRHAAQVAVCPHSHADEERRPSSSIHLIVPTAGSSNCTFAPKSEPDTSPILSTSTWHGHPKEECIVDVRFQQQHHRQCANLGDDHEAPTLLVRHLEQLQQLQRLQLPQQQQQAELTTGLAAAAAALAASSSPEMGAAVSPAFEPYTADIAPSLSCSPFAALPRPSPTCGPLLYAGNSGSSPRSRSGSGFFLPQRQHSPGPHHYRRSLTPSPLLDAAAALLNPPGGVSSAFSCGENFVYERDREAFVVVENAVSSPNGAAGAPPVSGSVDNAASSSSSVVAGSLDKKSISHIAAAANTAIMSGTAEVVKQPISQKLEADADTQGNYASDCLQLRDEAASAEIQYSPDTVAINGENWCLQQDPAGKAASAAGAAGLSPVTTKGGSDNASHVSLSLMPSCRRWSGDSVNSEGSSTGVSVSSPRGKVKSELGSIFGAAEHESADEAASAAGASDSSSIGNDFLKTAKLQPLTATATDHLLSSVTRCEKNAESIGDRTRRAVSASIARTDVKSQS